MKVIVTGGGTGGHIYPALAIVRHIQKNNKDATFLYIGTKGGLEASIVPSHHIPFKTVDISGFKRSLSIDNVKTLLKFVKAVRDSKRYIKEFKPDVVIGTGGYVCGPVVYAAAKKGIPSIIHEQNSVPGLTNKFLSKFADKIAISFESSATLFPKDKVVMTGNPRAQEVFEATEQASEGKLASLGLDPNKRTVLVVGGSRGARPINDAIIANLPEWGKKPFQCLYVTGEIHYENVKAEMEKLGMVKNIIVLPYLHDMPLVLNEVDLLVGRSGATTLSEITALGLPAILIPSPYVTNNHQEKNARALEKENAAKVILEKDMSPERLLEEVEAIITNESLRQEMAISSQRMGRRNATAEIYQLIEQLVNNKN